MTSVANLLTVLGEHFYLVAVACVEILAAVVLAAVFSGKKGLREKITEAIKLSVKDDYVIVGKSAEGLVYSLNERGREIVTNIQSSYSKAYAIGARIVCRKFANYTDEAVLKYISKLATE